MAEREPLIPSSGNSTSTQAVGYGAASSSAVPGRRPSVIELDSCWIVPLVAAIVSFLCYLISMSNGYLFVVFMDVYKVNREDAAWPQTVLAITGGCTGLLVSLLQAKISIYKITLIGSVVAAAGVAASSFAPNIPWLIVTFGVIQGVGLGSTLLGAATYVMLYFDKHKTAAMAIKECGTVAAGVTGVLITSSFTSKHGLQSCFLFIGGLMILMLPVIMLIKSPRPFKVCGAREERLLSSRGTEAFMEVREDAPGASPSEVVADAPSTSPSEDRADAPSTSRSEDRADAPSTTPSEDRVDAPSTTPSEDRADAPSISSSEDRADAPSTLPSEDRADAPSTSPSEDRADAPSTSPSEDRADAPSASPSDVRADAPGASHSEAEVEHAASPDTGPFASWNSLKRVFSGFDFPAFCILVTFEVISDSTFTAYATTIVDYAVDKGAALARAQKIPSYGSFGQGVGRVVVPFLTRNIAGIRSPLAAVCFLAAAFSYVTLPLVLAFEAVVGLVFLAGVAEGYVLTIKPLVIADHIGVWKYSFCCGVAGIFGIPFWVCCPLVVGWFRDAGGSYDNLYFLLAGLNLVVAVLFGLLACVDIIKRRRLQAQIPELPLTVLEREGA